MTKNLTAAAVQKEYGYSRSTLLRFEAEGLLTPVRPGGTGQRRYDPAQLNRLVQPVQKADSSPRPDFGELGTTGVRHAGGQVLEERLKELQGRQGRILLREMVLNDPIFGAVFFALQSAMKQASVRVKPASEKAADKQAAEFVDQCLHDMSFTWSDTETFIIAPMMEQGFSLVELCYKLRAGNNPPVVTNPQTKERKQQPKSRYSDNRIGWHKWASRPAETLAPGSEWVLDAQGGIHGINQMPVYPGTYAGPLVNRQKFPDLEPGYKNNPNTFSIPIEKLLHFRTTAHPANTPEGMPIHRPAYLSWYYTTQLQEIEGIGAERDLGGIPVIYLGNDRTLSGPDSDYSLAKDLVTNVRMDEQMGIVFPGPKMGLGGEGNGWLFELASTQGRRQWDIGAIIERYDKRKAIVVLAQFILLGMDRIGSYALSTSQSDLFIMAAKAWLGNIADVINRHAITRLIDFNAFPGLSGYPELVFSDIGIPNLNEIAEYVNKLVDKEVLTPDAELERHLRQVANLPQPVTSVKGQAEQPVKSPTINDSAKLLRQVGMALNPLLQTGEVSPDDSHEMITPLVDNLRTALASQPVAKDRGELVKMTCPICGFGAAEVHKSHGGIAVCLGCSCTYDPAMIENEVDNGRP